MRRGRRNFENAPGPEPGDLVRVYLVFDDDSMEWVEYNGVALVLDILELESLPGTVSGSTSPLEPDSFRLVTVLINGRVTDDYYENELYPV